MKGGGIICIVFGIDELVSRILKRINIGSGQFDRPRADLRIKRSEFSSFLKNFGSADYFFEDDFDDIISETEDRDIVGFTKKVGKGALLFLPCHFRYRVKVEFERVSFMDKIIPTLIDDLKKYQPKVKYKPPKWVNSYRFPNEAKILSEIENLEREINKRYNITKEYSKLKDVLWFRDDELVKSVMNFF